MSVYEWTPQKSRAAIWLANGYTERETGKEVGVTDRTIRRWKEEPEFSEEVDRLSLMLDIAGRAERLRIAKRIVRKKAMKTRKDLLDWLKFAQSETDGVNLNLTTLFEDVVSMAGQGQAGVGGTSEGESRKD